MSYEIVLSGDISREDIDSLRNDLEGVRIKVSAGISSDRIITIIGNLTKEHLTTLRKALLRMLGEKNTFSIKISKDGLELVDIPADKFESTITSVFSSFEKLTSKK